MVGGYVTSQEGTMFFSSGLLFTLSLALTKPYLRSDGEWHLVKWQSNPVKGDGERPYQAKNSWDFSQRVSVIIRFKIQLSNQHIWGGGCFTVSSMFSSGIVVDTCWIVDISTNQRPQVQRLQCCCILFCLTKALQLVQGLELWDAVELHGEKRLLIVLVAPTKFKMTICKNLNIYIIYILYI